MTVAEIKAKLPEAEVYEFREDAQYIILVDPNKVSRSAVEALAQSEMTIQAVILFVPAPLEGAVKILECKQ